MWFPRPTTTDALKILGPGKNVSVQMIHNLLHAPDAVEWKEKVGVMTPADGSAKATTRLLKSKKWVFKTDLNQKTSEPETLINQLQQLVDLAGRVELWHPEKVWFLMLVENEWWPVSACPKLTTIRQATTWQECLKWWTLMIKMGLEMSLKYDIGLDLNPSNFAYDHPDTNRLYYIDDEFYARHRFFDIAEAVVARIPEDPRIAPDQWEEWGNYIQEVVHPFCQHYNDWRDFLDGIREYPLTSVLNDQRNALLKGLNQTAVKPAVVKKPPQHEPKLTCVFADVHGNLPAFKTVLNKVKKLNVDSYLFLGDVVSYGPFPRECIQLLANMENVTAIRGNHDNTVGLGIPEDGSNRVAREMDSWTHQQLNQAEREWLLSLPVEHISPPWLAVHGAPQDPNRFYAYVYELTYKDNLSYLKNHDFQVCFYGHTHVPFIHRRLADNIDEKLSPQSIQLFKPDQFLLINPGSVGQPRDGDPRAAFAIWDRIQQTVTFHRISYPINDIINAVREKELPEDLIYRYEMGR